LTKEAIRSRFLDRIDDQRGRLKSWINRLSIYRLILFVGLVVGVSLSIEGDWAWLARPLTLVSLLIFLGLLKRHDSLFQKLELRNELRRQVINDLARLRGDFEALSEVDTSDWFDKAHRYAHDLDFTEPNSVLKLFGQPFHQAAKEELVSWFVKSFSAQEIRDRQEAVAELAGYLRFRRRFHSYNRMHSRADWSKGDLAAWRTLKAPRLMPFFLVLAVSLSIASTGSLVGSFFFGIPTPWGLFLSLQTIFFVLMAIYLKPMIVNFLAISRIAIACGSNMRAFSRKGWNSQLLLELRERAGLSTEKISDLVRATDQLDQALSVRKNGFAYLTLNLLFQWDVLYAFRLLRWRNATDFHLENWMDILFRIEALACMGHYANLFSSFKFPKVLSGKSIVFEARGLGHPSIPQNVRVCNDYAFEGAGRIDLLTGSNMSGKSTFLRTIGVNWAIARAGGPCCADALTCSNTPLWTSMRIQDSLAQGTSYFYAEVKRLEAILDDIAKSERSVFVLLDEILKGTNSRERFVATRALVRFLMQHKASGIISTHDLELLKINDPNLRNFHFSETIQGKNMSFDFQLKKGQLTSTNALKIIELAGLPLEFDAD